MDSPLWQTFPFGCIVMPSLQNGFGLDYVECLFVSDDVEDTRPSAIADNPVRSVQATLPHLERRLNAGLPRVLVVGVCDRPSLDLPLQQGFCVSTLLRQARQRWRDSLTLIADVGLSPYQTCGHSVLLSKADDVLIDEEGSYVAAARLAEAFIAAGADAVAPCLSLPRQTGAIRAHLDAAGLEHGEILPYTIKFSSSLYGPYREAIGSDLGLLRKSYQFDQGDAELALGQLREDLSQGAVGTIVKPALPYLDLLARTASTISQPVAVYHVSGEYMMAIQAAGTGLIHADDYFDEVHAAFRRCGARYVIGYAADHFLRWQSSQRDR